MPVYWIWLAGLKGLSIYKKRQLLETYGDPEGLWRLDSRNLPADVAEALQQKDLSEAMEIYRKCTLLGIGVVGFGDGEYPPRLRSLEDPPIALYYKGKLPQWQAQPVIAIVGTRKASSYGMQTTGLLASQIAACGGLVVSGAATGVDRRAMEAAIAQGKPVVGVLGGGVDVVYPAANRDLYLQTQEHGCLISEYPPGSRPFPGNFLQRNRIISGLSDGVLIVEAPERSGALNTAQHAFAQGRDVYAVPGNLGVDSCAGSNRLLQEGAYPGLSGWDVVKQYENLYPGAVENRRELLRQPEEAPLPKVAEAALTPEKPRQKRKSTSQISIDNGEESTYSVINERPANLSDQENEVLALLSHSPRMIDSILDASDLPFGTVQSILTRLAIKGLVNQYPDGRISRK